MTLRVHPDEIVRTSASLLLAIHDSWERARLGDVADVLNGFAFKSALFGRQNGMPLLRIRDVGRSDTATSYSGEYDAMYVVERGSIVVGMDGDFRVALWTGRPALLNQRVCKITVRDEDLFEHRFLLHVLQGYLDAINAQTSSVTVKHLSSRTVQDIPLPLPPLNEQRRIVAAIEEQLSRLDAADASLSQARRRLDAFRRAALVDGFNGSWPRVPLKEVTDEGRPICYGILKPKTVGDLRVPYVEVRSIKNGRVDVESLHRTTRALHDEFKRSELRAGDVVLAIRGSFDRAAVVPVQLEGANVSRDVARIAPLPVLDSSYLAHYLGGPVAYRYFARAARGVAVRGVNIGDLRTMPIPLPPLEEQKRIVAEVEKRLSVIDVMRASIERAERRSAALRRSILERAFRGELVPQDPSDEPASVLLDRIRAERAADEPTSRRKATTSRPAS